MYLKKFEINSVNSAIDFLLKNDLMDEAYYQYFHHKSEDEIVIKNKDETIAYFFKTSDLENVLSWYWHM